MSAWAAITSEYGSHVNVHYFGVGPRNNTGIVDIPSNTWIYWHLCISYTMECWYLSQLWADLKDWSDGCEMVLVYRMTLGQPALNGRGRAETHKSTFQIFFISSRDAMWNSALAKLPAWFQGHLRVKSANCHAGTNYLNTGNVWNNMDVEHGWRLHRTKLSTCAGSSVWSTLYLLLNCWLASSWWRLAKPRARKHSTVD